MPFTNTNFRALVPFSAAAELDAAYFSGGSDCRQGVSAIRLNKR